jgi:hypothetical protein
MSNIAYFEWPVATSGYYWDEAGPTAARVVPRLDQQMLREPLLIPRAPINDRDKPRLYEPLQVTDLFRRFAGVKLTDKAILRFADRRGLLTTDWHLWFDGSALPPGGTYCEPQFFWGREIVAMRELLHLWDLAKKEDVGGLQKHIAWREGPRRVVAWRGEHYRSDIEWVYQGFTDDDIKKTEEFDDERAAGTIVAFLDGIGSTPLLGDRWKWGDVLEPARYYVFREVNKRLNGHTSPVVDPFEKGRIFLQPDSLLTALYVQFAMELAGWTRPQIICRGCGSFFVPTHASQEFCSVTCRKRQWYMVNKGTSKDGKTGKR